MDIEVSELKLELKQWELNFLKKYSRKPTKKDVVEYPDIKAKYNRFTSLKKDLVNTRDSQSSRKILSPKNEEENRAEHTTECFSQVSANDGGVWGSNLLKKNSAKDESFVAESSQKDENENCERKKNIGCDWRAKIRKNTSTHGSIKKLQSSLRMKGRTVLHPNNTLQSLNEKTNASSESAMYSPFQSECSSNTDKSPVFGSQVRVTTKYSVTDQAAARGIMDATPVLSSPFNTRVTKKHSLLTKPINIDSFNAEDLSDLTNIAKNEDKYDEIEPRLSSEKRKSSSSNVDEEKLAPFQDETKTYIETNFRDQPKDDLLKREEIPKFSYEDVCLSSENFQTTEVNPDKSQDEVQDVIKPDGSSKDLNPSLSGATSSKPSVRNSARGNYVMLNMKKKQFSRRGRNGNFLRKQILRQKMAKKGYSFKSGWKGRSGGAKRSGTGSWRNTGSQDKSSDKCFKCGGIGHWASNCRGQGYQQKKLDAENELQEKESLEEVLENADLIAAALKGETPPDFLCQKISVSVCEPIIEQDDDTPLTDNKEVMAALKMFKYSSFRPGQDKAIRRILKGKSTLLVLSTGSGKSLCYQLPAYLYAIKKNAITLVVSPLVSLMDDQVRGLPRKMKATRIHSGMTKEQRDKALAEVENGNIHVLLVSPEAITSWAGMSPKYSPLSKLPPIAFACVDECHCLSEWSHAFRPSYLRVCQVLKDQLGVKCLVGLTATATMDTCASVAKQLGITDPCEGVIAKIDIPENLVLSVSKDKYKDEALAALLLGERFSKLDSVIVYCTRRDEAARIASLLRIKMMDMPSLQHQESEDEANIQENPEKSTRKRKHENSKSISKRKAVTLDAECYHAGMSAAERKRIQNKFMNGSLRVVVATVAFGMGIDKQDVRSVIHYNMPMSFERYVQEVGRAGRDCKPAHCHLFLDADGQDLNELSRHCYGKSIDRYIIKKFVRKLFPSCKCPDDGDDCTGHFVAIPIDSTIEELDVKREGLETLLCYLEIEGLLKVYLPTETHCTLQFYGGPGQTVRTAKKVHAVALAMKLAGTKGDQTQVDFNAVELADDLNMELPALKKVLRYLTYDTTLSTSTSEVQKSGIEVQFSEMSFCIRSKQKATDEFLDAVTDSLHRRVIAQENKELSQLQMCFSTLQKFAHCNVGTCRDSIDESQSRELKNIITNYFKVSHPVNDTERDVASVDPSIESGLRGLVKQFLLVYGNDLGNRVTGRAIARIFHGIDSPLYSAKVWGTVRRFWRSKLDIDFNLIRKIATEEILMCRK